MAARLRRRQADAASDLEHALGTFGRWFTPPTSLRPALVVFVAHIPNDAVVFDTRPLLTEGTKNCPLTGMGRQEERYTVAEHARVGRELFHEVLMDAGVS